MWRFERKITLFAERKEFTEDTMTIVLKDDSDGNTRQIWAQEQASSCAIASIWMARNQAKQQTINESEWHLAWTLYQRVVQGMVLVPEPPAGQTFNPGSYGNDQNSFGNMFANAGTYMRQVSQQLTNEGYHVTASNLRVIDPTILSETKPAIILLGWYWGGARHGGHFVVAVNKVSSGQIVYLDPWGGELYERGVGPDYRGTGRFESIIYLTAPDP